MATDNELRELEEASNSAADAAGAELDASLKTVMDHVARGGELKPKVHIDDPNYQQVIRVIGNATQNNESIAALRTNIRQLGTGAVALVHDMAATVAKVS